MLILAALVSSLLSSNAGPALRPGCEKVCQKQILPCDGPREDEQMMCVRVVRRCEVRCEGAKKK